MTRVSVIIPCYCNAPHLASTLAAIGQETELLCSRGVVLQLILVDDASTDDTWQVIRSLKQHSELDIVGLRLPANVGSYHAVLCGMREASGHAVIVMAADGDDPPQLIPELVRHWQLGHPLVQASRASAGTLPTLYYALLRWSGARNIPKCGSDFMLADRALVARAFEAGFRPGNTLVQLYQTADHAMEIPYAKGTRPGGGWSLLKKCRLFVDSFLALAHITPRLKVVEPVERV